MKEFDQENFEKYCKECRHKSKVESIKLHCWRIGGLCEYGHPLCEYDEVIKREKPEDNQGDFF